MKLRCTLCAYCLTAVAIPQTVAAQNYTFTNIADTSGLFSLFYGSTRLNNSGAVSFIANLDAGGSGVYRSDGASITTIADDTGPLRTFLYSDINDGGQVAYLAESIFGPGIFRGNGLSTIAMVYQSELPFVDQEFLDDGQTSMNNAGTIAFFAHGRVGSTVIDGVFTSSGGNIMPISDTFEYRALGQQINNLGTVAFYYQLFTAGSGIRLGNGGTTSIVIDNTGPYSGFGRPGLNDSNVVAVAAVNDGGGVSVLRIDGATVDVVAGPYTSVLDVSINNADDVAFLAELTPGMRGILTGPDPVADKVIGDGDALFGSTVTISQGGTIIDGPNDAGQIVFRYSLADGRQGIALATPAAMLDGDFNCDGTVNAADYVTLRKDGGTQDDFNLWRAHFGQSAGSGSGASANTTVPEPATIVMLIVATVGMRLRRRCIPSECRKLNSA